MTNRSNTGENPIEVRRYADALRRNLLLIVLITVVVAAAPYLLSSSLTKPYAGASDLAVSDLAAGHDHARPGR